MNNEHSVACENDDQEGEWVKWARKTTVVGEYTSDGDDDKCRCCDGDVEDLSCGDVPIYISFLADL